MDLRFVSSLLAVIDEGSMAAAARAEGITPSAVTQRIAALEAELKIPLLQRSGRVMQPTPQARAALPRLRQLLRLERELHAGVQEQALAGPLRIGAISTAMADHAPGLVRALQAHAPQIEPQLAPGTSRELYSAFGAETLDAALLVQPPFDLPKTMDFAPVAAQATGILRPAEGGANLPFIVYSRSAWGGAVCWEALQALAPGVRVLAEMDALETIAQMVQDGLGQAVLPSWQGLRARFPGTRFEPLQAPARRIGLLTWSRDRDHPALAILRAALPAVT